MTRYINTESKIQNLLSMGYKLDEIEPVAFYINQSGASHFGFKLRCCDKKTVWKYRCLMDRLPDLMCPKCTCRMKHFADKLFVRTRIADNQFLTHAEMTKKEFILRIEHDAYEYQTSLLEINHSLTEEEEEVHQILTDFRHSSSNRIF